MLSTEVSRRVGKVRFVDNPLCMDEEEYLPEKRRALHTDPDPTEAVRILRHTDCSGAAGHDAPITGSVCSLFDSGALADNLNSLVTDFDMERRVVVAGSWDEPVPGLMLQEGAWTGAPSPSDTTAPNPRAVRGSRKRPRSDWVDYIAEITAPLAQQEDLGSIDGGLDVVPAPTALPSQVGASRGARERRGKRKAVRNRFFRAVRRVFSRGG